jgi:nucleoside-diphosphate kinase
MIERTLAIIKPDAVSRAIIGEVIMRYEKQNFRILEMKMMHLSKKEAEGFYEVHRSRPFFNDLTDFMASGPVVVMLLEGEEVIKRHRELMGETDPRRAEQGTLRADFGTDIQHNVVHGSDSKATATFEIKYFFPKVN